jgi:hypothetical protein
MEPRIADLGLRNADLEKQRAWGMEHGEVISHCEFRIANLEKHRASFDLSTSSGQEVRTENPGGKKPKGCLSLLATDY